EIAKAQADADNARIEKGVVTPEEVREQRYIQGDVDGPLRLGAVDGDEDKDVTAPPAQVGIATAMLEGALAVATGQITMEFFAGYLQAIDPQRFPLNVAHDLARKAAAGTTPKDPDEESSTASPQVINAATVMSAGGQVAQGKMAGEFFEQALLTMAP